MIPLSSQSREAFEQFKERVPGDGAWSKAQMVQVLNRPRSTVTGWIDQWLQADMIEESDNSRLENYRLTGFMPEDRALGAIPGICQQGGMRVFRDRQIGRGDLGKRTSPL